MSVIPHSFSHDWELSKNAFRFIMDSNNSFIRIPEPPSNPPEALRGGIHTLDELISPSNNQHDNANGIMLEYPNHHPPLRLTLHNEDNPSTQQANLSSNLLACNDNVSLPEGGPLIPRNPQIHPNNDSGVIRVSENQLIIEPSTGEREPASSSAEIVGKPFSTDPLDLLSEANYVSTSPRVQPDLNLVMVLSGRLQNVVSCADTHAAARQLSQNNSQFENIEHSEIRNSKLINQEVLAF